MLTTFVEGSSEFPVETQEEYRRYIERYCTAILDGVDRVAFEKPKKVMPVTFFLRLKFNEKAISPYNDVVRNALVIAAQNAVTVTLAIPPSGLMCCVVVETCIVDCAMSIRVQFPYIRCAVNLQRSAVQPRFADGLRSVKVLRDGIVDILGKPLQLHGNSLDGKQIERTSVIDGQEYSQDYSLSIPVGDHQADLEESVNDVNCLVSALTIDYSPEVVEEKAPVRRSVRSSVTPSAGPSKRLYEIETFDMDSIIVDDDKISVLEINLGMVSDKRYADKFDWECIGEAIFDAHQGSLLGLSLWTDSCTNVYKRVGRMPVFIGEAGTDVACSMKWSSFTLDRTTVIDIATMAEEDSLQDYSNWHGGWCKPTMENAVSCSSWDVAVAFHRNNWTKIMCSADSRGCGLWYYFDGGRMRYTPGGSMLRRWLSTSFRNLFRPMLADIAVQAADSRDITTRQKSDEIISNIGYLMEKLKDRKFKDAVMRDLADICVRDNLMAMFDSRVNVLGLPGTGRVLIATDLSIEIKKGRPEFFTTKCIGVVPRDDYSWDHADIKEEQLTMNRVHGFNDEVIRYHYAILCHSLRGGNIHKLVVFFTNKMGDNGKSIDSEVTQAMFGSDYAPAIPAESLTYKHANPEAANPVMADLQGAHISTTDEPSKHTPLKGDVIKRITGDFIRVRRMRQDGCKIPTTHIPFIIVNVPPPTDEISDPLKNRMIFIDFGSVFNEKAPADEEEQKKLRHFPADYDMRNKIRRRACARLWILMQNYPALIKTHLKRDAPEVVKARTKGYWNDVDSLLHFLEKSTADDETESIEEDKLYDEYKRWYRRTHNNSSEMLGIDSFREEVSNRWKYQELVDGEWRGKKLLIVRNNLEEFNGVTW